MKTLSSRFLPFLAAMLMLVFFAACEKDEIKTIEETAVPPTTTTTTTVTSPVVGRIASQGTQNQSNSSTGGLEIECIAINFPFDFLVDSVSYTMNDIDDVEDLFTNIVTNTTMSINFVYPLNITLEDGSTTTVANDVEISMLVSSCIPGSGWGTGSFPAFFFDDPECISISYPVTLEDADGTTVQANNETEFVNLLAVNPHYTFVFPINVVDTTGNVSAVQGEQELFDIIAQCASSGTGTGNGGGSTEIYIFLGGGCFSYNYPIDIIDANGNISSVADENEFSAALLNGEFFNFVYSFNVTLETDGSVVSIDDQDDFVDVLENCFGSFSPPVYAVDFISRSLYDSCYTMVYPFNIDDSGTIITISSGSEALAFLDGGEGAIVFPLDVIAGGVQFTLANASEYEDLSDNCGGSELSAVPAIIFLGLGIDSTSCYELVYPVTVTSPDGTTFTLATEAEVTSYLQGAASDFIVFPVDVIERSTGNILTVLGIDDFLELLESC